METLAPSTEKSDAEAPETVRDRDLGGTTPMPRLEANAKNADAHANATARLPVLDTAPMRISEPVRISTQPIAAPVKKRERLTYAIYSSDDTLLGAPALVRHAHGSAPASGDSRRKRFGLALLGLTVALGTTLAGLGSCDERTTARVETTSASMTTARPAATTSTALTAPKPTAEAPTPMPAITFVPPLGPLPKAAPRRAPVPRPINR